ncbi:ATP-binding protein [Desulfovibrio ferrophilus]|uniref:ATP-binding protein n=1 Tax=Desulfovibrio ferrophilus TaxID=241368 RepID=UPI001E3906FE|nr:ATP-binding protein [Desulfovibrio ferrophilus]
MKKTVSPFSDPARPFQLVKFLSWSSLVLILGTTLMMSVLIANTARESLLAKQREFAQLLAENLNHQIFQRFTVPTVLRYGYIGLKNEEQYRQMDTVVTDTIHGQHVLELRVYDINKVVSYSTNEELVGREDLAGSAVTNALKTEQHSFEIISKVSPFWSMFRLDMEPESVIMRMTYPLKTERSLFQGGPGVQIMGILEFTQDITGDFKAAVNFQWVITAISSGTALVLFFMLVLFIRRADAINAQRVTKVQGLERELLQSEKLASMGRVVAGIAHEIRNPLGIIQSSAELLLKKAKVENASRVQIIQVMFDEIKRLSQTVNDFLDYARPKTPRRDPVDLSQVLEQARVFLDQKAQEARVDFVCEYPANMMVKGDKDLLYRAVYNIVVNAMQAMKDGGELRIEGEVTRREVCLKFTDQGTGFAPEVMEKLADPFFTTKDSGTGLGLAIVVNILDSHGAEIDFANASQGGAQVTVRFEKG